MSINIVIGCMFSGKTSEIIKICKKWQQIGKNVLCINHINDDGRYGELGDAYTYSHDGQRILSVKVGLLSDVNSLDISVADVVLVNEAQFFADLVETCTFWADTLHKNIVVSGLDGDSDRKPFGRILELIPQPKT